MIKNDAADVRLGLNGVHRVVLMKTVIWERDDNFEYFVEDNKAYIIRYWGNKRRVKIPSTLGGYRVAGVYDTTFSGMEGIEVVTLPNTIKEI